MDFEEMKVIWDSQNNEPLYAVDTRGLQAVVRSKRHEFERRIFWRGAREIGIGVAMGALLLYLAGVGATGGMLPGWISRRVAVSGADLLALAGAAGLWLFYAVFQWVERRRQERREHTFEASLRGDLDRVLARTAQQLRLARNAVWWGVIPVWIATVLFCLTILKLAGASVGLRLLMTAVVALGSVFDLRCKRRPIANELLPLQEEFQALRAKLAEPET